MDKNELDEYRRIIESEYSKKDNEIETTTSYISVGLLGFFITINEKYISLNESTCKFLFTLSLLSYSLSFVLILYRKYVDQKSNLEILDQISSMSSGRSEGDEARLYKIWYDGNCKCKRVLKLSFIFLAIGVASSVVFILTNLS
jgi:hypothetical protein